MRALKASCSLLVPFTLQAPTTPEAWREALLARRMAKRSEPAPTEERDLPLWERVPDADRHIRHFELAGTLRTALFEAQEGAPGGTLLRMADKALQAFRHVGVAYGDTTLPARLETVEAHLLSAEEGVLTLHFDLAVAREGADSKTPGVPLSEVYAKVFSLRHYRPSSGERAKDVGLTFGRPSKAPPPSVVVPPPQPAYLEALGPHLARGMWNALAQGQPAEPVEIGTFANWLLLRRGERPGATSVLVHLDMTRCVHGFADRKQPRPLPAEAKVLLGTYGLTHTHVYLDRSPGDPAEARQILWRLRRAYREEYVAPPHEPDADTVLQPRGNRWVGISREGTAALAWLNIPAPGGAPGAPLPATPEELATAREMDHEYVNWPVIWNGLYRSLLVHSVAATRMLERRRTTLAAAAAEIRPGASASTIAQHRALIAGLITAHATEALTFPVERAGGTTEYDEFYMAARRVQGTSEAWERLRQAIADIARVEQALHDDQQAKREEEQRLAEAEEAKREKFLTGIASGLAIALVPAGIAQGAVALFPGHFSTRSNESRLWFVALLALGTAAVVAFWYWWRVARKGRSRQLQPQVPMSRPTVPAGAAETASPDAHG